MSWSYDTTMWRQNVNIMKHQLLPLKHAWVKKGTRQLMIVMIVNILPRWHMQFWILSLEFELRWIINRQGSPCRSSGSKHHEEHIEQTWVWFWTVNIIAKKHWIWRIILSLKQTWVWFWPVNIIAKKHWMWRIIRSLILTGALLPPQMSLSLSKEEFLSAY